MLISVLYGHKNALQPRSFPDQIRSHPILLREQWTWPTLTIMSVEFGTMPFPKLHAR